MENENLTGTTDYQDYLDKKVIILLWDGKYLHGTLRSFDQFNSIALENVMEITLGKSYCTHETHKVFIVRGENVVMIGIGVLNIDKYKYLDYDAFNSMTRESEGAEV